jgi:hypothetical protein
MPHIKNININLKTNELETVLPVNKLFTTWKLLEVEQTHICNESEGRNEYAIKIVILWVEKTYNIPGGNRRFVGTFCRHLEGWKENQASILAIVCLRLQVEKSAREEPAWAGGDAFLRDVGSHKIYTALHPRRRHSSLPPLRKLPMLQFL